MVVLGACPPRDSKGKDESNPPSASTKSGGGEGPACVQRGIAYYKEIGSYPKLSDGRLASEVVADRCARTTTAF